MRFFLLFFIFNHFLNSSFGQVYFNLETLPSQYTPTPDALFITGNFNNWNPRDTMFRFRKNEQGMWQVAVLTSLSNLEYKITKGSWETVEATEQGANISNRICPNTPGLQIGIHIAGWSDTKSLHTATKEVRVLASPVWLKALQRYRRIWVYLPGNYEKEPNRHYPVIYFHDGQNIFDNATSAYGEWKLDEALNQLEKEPGWEPIIAVGIDHGGTERLNELTPFRHPKYGGGLGENYAKAVVEDVKPLIDSLFRTKSKAASTGIAGSSLGGIESLYMAYAYPNVFSKALIFSPALWFSDSLRQFCKSKPPSKNLRLYWVCGTNEGDEDMVPDFNECYEDLLKAGRPKRNMKKRIVSGGTHSESFWSSEVKAGIYWLFKK